VTIFVQSVASVVEEPKCVYPHLLIYSEISIVQDSVMKSFWAISHARDNKRQSPKCWALNPFSRGSWPEKTPLHSFTVKVS
jgi:hypothetical protein